MADPPSVTAILPTRNRPALLAEALHSVLAQTVPPAQVIIVDDGGADDAERLVEPTLGLSEVAITVLRGPGRGPGPARNAALRAATGELIAFLDDDDLWWPRRSRCRRNGSDAARLSASWEQATPRAAGLCSLKGRLEARGRSDLSRWGRSFAPTGSSRPV